MLLFFTLTHTHALTHTSILWLSGFCPGQSGWVCTRRNIHPLTPIVVISHPLPLSPSITIHGILAVQFTCLTVFFHNLSPKFSLVNLLAWHPPLRTPSISSPNHCLLFTAHCPYHRKLFLTVTEYIFVSLSLDRHKSMVYAVLAWCSIVRYIIWLTHLQCERLLFRSSCLSSVVCLSSICLSRIRSWNLSEIHAKFCHLYRKSGSPSKNMMSDFAPEVAK